MVAGCDSEDGCGTTTRSGGRWSDAEPETHGVYMAQKQKPIQEIRLGRIRAAIWANQTEGLDVWFNVTVARRSRC